MKRSISLVALFALLVACGGAGDTAVGSQAPPTSDSPTLTIEGRAFGPGPEVAAGDSFNISNLDSVRHTFTSRDDAWEEVRVDGGAQVVFTVPESLAPGSYNFFCAIHTSMAGALTVTE
jgi:plastocyanin